MRSSTRLITVLIAALLLVTPLTIASAQTGTDGYDEYWYSGDGGNGSPVVLPQTGDSGATSALISDEWFTDNWTSIPAALPVTGGDLSWLTGLDRQTILDHIAAAGASITGAVPEFLPTTGVDLSGFTGLDRQTILDHIAAAGGIVIGDLPGLLPVTGADSSMALPDMEVDEFAVAAGDSLDYGVAFAGDAPDLLPVTGSDGPIVLPDMEPYEFDVAGAGSEEPIYLPVTGDAASDLPSVSPDGLIILPMGLGAGIDTSDLGGGDFAPLGLPVTGADTGEVIIDLSVIAYQLAASGVEFNVVGEPVALPVTGLDVSILPDDARYALAASGFAVGDAQPALPANDIPFALPVTGFEGSDVPDWVQSQLGLRAYIGGFIWPDDAAYLRDSALGAEPASLPVTGFVWPDDAAYLRDSALGAEPASLPATGFVWPDDATYISDDSHIYNDSGAAALSKAPDVLPQTGSGRLDVVGGR